MPVDVADYVVRYRRLGTPGAPLVMLVHGGGAHFGWWIDVAPLLARRHDVAVVDLSGHGDSDHCGTYGPQEWARELAAVVRSIGLGPAHIVGHSLGGMVGVHLAAESPEVVRSVTLVDSAVRRRAQVTVRGRRRVKFYDTLEESLTHFRLQPSGTIAPPHRLRGVATAGLVETCNGWRWKADPNALIPLSREDLADAASRVTCPLGFILGGKSELTDEGSVEDLALWSGSSVRTVTIREAFHHVPLDAPQAAFDALTSIIDPSRNLAPSGLTIM